jgi:restriction system protein
MATSTPTTWSIHSGESGDAESLFLEHNYIAIGWAKMGHLGLLPNDKYAFTAKVENAYPEDVGGASAQGAGQTRRFVYEMQIGDVAVYRPKVLAQGTVPLVFFGRVAGPYLYNPYIQPGYPNLRRVEWLHSVPASHFSKQALDEQAAWMSLSIIDEHAQEFLDALDGVR